MTDRIFGCLRSLLLRYSSSVSLNLCFLSFQLPRAGCRESFANWFCQGNLFARIFLLPVPQGSLSLKDDSPVSCSCQLSRAFTRLVILRRSVNPQICWGFKRREGGSALHYTCLTPALFMTLPKLLAVNGSINKQKLLWKLEWHSVHFTATQRIPASFGSLMRRVGVFCGESILSNSVNRHQSEQTFYVYIQESGDFYIRRRG